MGICRYCKRPAGLFRQAHPECEQKHREGQAMIHHAIKQVLQNPQLLPTIKEQLPAICKEHFFTSEELLETLAYGWVSEATQEIENKRVTLDKWAAFMELKHAFNITKPELERRLAQTAVVTELVRAITSGQSPGEVEATLAEIKSILLSGHWREALIEGWETTVETFLSDKLINAREEERLLAYARYFGLADEELDRNGAFTRVVKSIVLRELCEGKIPQRVQIEGKSPFNFQKNEKIIWVFKNVQYYEDRKRRQYVGGHSGFSIRIAKGVYYRVGAFKGHPVDTVERVYLGTGMLVVTDRHLYFKSEQKAFRIRLDKIIMIEPYSDGVAIQRDAQTALPQTFITGDGWFTYNLLVNIPHAVK
jgi:hypothetical protein